MPRPQRCRRICVMPRVETFSPQGKQEDAPIQLTLDEYEVIRLLDLEACTQEACARQMDISRSTVQEVYESARRKIAACLVYGRALRISGGNYRVCEGSDTSSCGRCEPGMTQKNQNEHKGVWVMKVAVTYDHGEIFQHFGHTEQFKIYEIEDGKVLNVKILDTNGSGHGALAGFLMGEGVDTLICGGIGGGAQMALAEAGIRLYGGVSGNADDAVAALLAGNLGYDPDVRCSHHDHAHGEEGHTCGSHGCGNHGCH